MSAAKHTPGPWRQHLVKVQRNIYGELGWTVAYTHGMSRINPDEDFANALLIAAAPDLLEALQDLVTNGPSSSRYEKALAAIAKATGEA